MNLNKRRGAPQHDEKHGFITLLIKAFLVFTISVIIQGLFVDSKSRLNSAIDIFDRLGIFSFEIQFLFKPILAHQNG